MASTEPGGMQQSIKRSSIKTHYDFDPKDRINLNFLDLVQIE
jgi:hypothetical protein